MVNRSFIEECKNRTNSNRLGNIILKNNDIIISNSDNLQSFSINSGCYSNGNLIGTVYLKYLDGKLVCLPKNINLLNEEIQVQVGIKYDENTREYINLGNYIVERPQNIETADLSSFKAFDKLATNIDKPYLCTVNFYNATIADVYLDVCNQLGLAPKTISFLNNNIPVSNNPFTNNESCRTVLQSIAKVACSFVEIDVETDEIDLSWVSQNDEPDYIFEKSDYSVLEGAKITYGPLNTVVVKNSQIDDENVSMSDDESIAQYGEHQLVINEDYFLYNAELRRQAIPAIFSRLNGFKYVDCKLTTYYGKPFLKLGSKIRIKLDEGYIDTYVLIHTFTYDGTFTSVIESPVLTEKEIQNKQDVSLNKKLENTQFIVNKQGKIIEGVVEQVDGQEVKIASIKEQVDNINLKVSDTNNGTASGESSNAKIDLDYVDATSQLYINVHPVRNNDISLTYPYNGLFPSDNTFTRVEPVKTIKFTNKTTSEEFTYVIPYELFYFDEETYDEFILDSDSNTCKVIQRVGFSNGDKYALDNPNEISITYPTINLTAGDYTVELVNYDYAFIKVITNSTQHWATSAEIDIAVDSISSSVTSTTAAVAELSSTVDSLRNEVDDNYNEVISKFNDYAPNSRLYELTNAVNNIETSTYTKTQIQQIANGTGVDGVKVTAVVSTEATFDKDGMHYQKTDAPSKSTINQYGLKVDGTSNNAEILYAGYDPDINSSTYGSSIVRTDNLTVKTYLKCGGTGRIESYTDANNNTGVGFYIGVGD